MPQYIYQHPKTKKVIELTQSIHDKHEYIDKDRVKWNRIYTAPKLNTDGTLKSTSTQQDFLEYTKNKKGTMGDLWDMSGELSEKRSRLYGGVDPVKTEYQKKWSKKRKGKKHPDSKKIN
jgi:hypothetical protein